MHGTIAQHRRLRHKPIRRAPLSLFEFLARAGGLRPHPDLAYLLDGNPVVAGNGRLIRQDGMSLDRAREACCEARYIRDPGWDSEAPATSTIADLLELIAAEARGLKQYAEGEWPAAPIDLDEQEHYKVSRKKPSKRRARGRAAEDHPAAMTGAEFRAALLRLGFHKASGNPTDTGLMACSRFFGYAPRPVMQWAVDGPPAAVAVTLKLMLKTKIDAARAAELLS